MTAKKTSGELFTEVSAVRRMAIRFSQIIKEKNICDEELLAIIDDLKIYVRTGSKREDIPQEFYQAIDNCRSAYCFTEHHLVGILIHIQWHTLKIMDMVIRDYIARKKIEEEFENDEQD